MGVKYTSAVVTQLLYAFLHGLHTLPAHGLTDNQQCQTPGCVNYTFMANSPFLPWKPLCFPLLASFLRDMVPSMPDTCSSCSLPECCSPALAPACPGGAQHQLRCHLPDTRAPVPASQPPSGNPTPGVGRGSNPCGTPRHLPAAGHGGIRYSRARWLSVRNPARALASGFLHGGIVNYAKGVRG